MEDFEYRLTIRLSPTDRANLATISRLATAGPLARRDASAAIRHALDIAAAVLMAATPARAV